MSKKKDLKKGETIVRPDLEDLVPQPVLPDYLTGQWQVNDYIVEVLLDQTMHVLKDKELKKRTPMFSVCSTMALMHKAVGMKEFLPDRRQDDDFIHAEDGEEQSPPPLDNLGAKRKLNDPEIVAKFAAKRVD